MTLLIAEVALIRSPIALVYSKVHRLVITSWLRTYLAESVVIYKTVKYFAILPNIEKNIIGIIISYIISVYGTVLSSITVIKVKSGL